MNRSKLLSGTAVLIALSLAGPATGMAWASSTDSDQDPTKLVKIVKSEASADKRSDALTRLEQLAISDPDAKRRLAELYLVGEGVDGDAAKALRLLEEAGADGSTVALRKLASLYRSGDIVELDRGKALALTRRAAELNDSWAQLSLSDTLRKGDGVDQDIETAISWLEKSAAAGNATAQLRLGSFLADGKLIPQDETRAIELLEKSVAKGNAGAKIELAGLLMRDGERADPERGAQLLREAAESDDKAKMRLAELLVSGELIELDLPQGISMFEELSAGGNSKATKALISIYSGGEISADAGRLVELHTRLADAGDADALVRLGEIYRDGIIVPADLPRSLEFFKAAEESGSSRAWRRVAEAALRGFGEDADPDKAVSILRAEIDKGNLDASIYLADILAAGDYVDADLVAARTLYENAAEGGKVNAHRQLARLYLAGVYGAAQKIRARDHLNAAIDKGDEASIVTLANAHLSGSFGRQSDARLGLKLLQDGRQEGISAATTTLAEVYFRGRGVGRDAGQAVRILTEEADKGNAAAARALIEAYRSGKGKSFPASAPRARAALEKYSALLNETQKTREAFLIDARIAASLAQYEQLDEKIAGVPVSQRRGYIEALRSANQNAYVYVVQKGLKKVGRYDGPINGLLTASTIRAIREICEAGPSGDRCRMGPLHSAAAKVVSARLEAIY
ncbi:sel1 repeat family protein (plasmid) [Rhizobium rosettiformans]|uniref:Sel1 repeat family protein n=1 Tax=Rhizobium rosettiformans TaxID=1368430 RepID=A0ABX7F2L9_9HYPH|nr:tetratricopeptide repeat protein [Rhizobium rosettiformans]QRF54353.1 sel1 repeat family protein [Rhizobium rosettiformans]